jgi:hypothetical protein
MWAMIEKFRMRLMSVMGPVLSTPRVPIKCQSALHLIRRRACQWRGLRQLAAFPGPKMVCSLTLEIF